MESYMNLFDTCVYTFSSKDNILEEKDLGISSDISSIRTPEHSVAALNCFQGCPYTNTGFTFDVRLDGEKFRCNSWQWLPDAMHRHGSNDSFQLDTLTVVVPGMRTAIEKLTITNKTSQTLTVPIQVAYRGVTRKEENWHFAIPAPEKDAKENYSADNRFLFSQKDGGAYILTTSLETMRMFRQAYLWEGTVTVEADRPLTVYFSAHMGQPEACRQEAEYTLDNYEPLIAKAFDWIAREADRIHQNLPRISTDVPALNKLYYRSLVTYILCRWENPDLCAVPYFSTGGINGGCMCSYLWNYCGGLMFHPLYDPEGNKKQIRALLKNDLTTCYALNPVTAGSVGPWYQVNQEKIIQMVYYHVLFTGDKDFLFEKAGDKTILEWMRVHAYVCDDLSKDADLYDYGIGGRDHLELREYDGIKPYDGIIPELNARRYMNYMLVYALTQCVGQPDEQLPIRAEQLKPKLKTLWNKDAGWYDFISADGERSLLYTVQMFKFLDSPVIGQEEREALIAHLNDREFLSKFGVHSISKLDEQYSQDDIDNGGGGICNFFAMRICDKLYALGYDTLATDILRRTYWWGSRMPYMGDSVTANMVMAREDTPLHGDIASVGCAQTIFYSIFGIKATFDSKVTIAPVKNRPAENMKAENAKLCGKVFTVEITGDTFTVMTASMTQTAKIGQQIVLD